MADGDEEEEWIGKHEIIEELDGVDLATASLDDMTGVLRNLESDKQGLLEAIRALRVRLAEEKADQSDVYYYLHKKLDDNYDVISALERQLMVETADREKAETEFAHQIDELERRRDEELGPLREKLISAEEQLNSMHDAAERKRESDATRIRLEEELRSAKTVVEDDLTVEKRKKLQDKQRVRRQVEAQIRDLSTELLSKKEVELADKTVRAADNNEKLHTALQAKAKQAERMMVVNQGLAFENTSLRNDVDLARASEVVLSKRVRLYHDLVIGLKAQLEQEAAVDEKDEQELADLEESLTGGGGALETMSLMSDATPGAQVIWAGGACGGLVYESAAELRVAVESLQHLHAELREDAETSTERAERAKTAAAAAAAAVCGSAADHDNGDDNAMAACLLKGAEEWLEATAPNRSSPIDNLRNSTTKTVSRLNERSAATSVASRTSPGKNEVLSNFGVPSRSLDAVVLRRGALSSPTNISGERKRRPEIHSSRSSKYVPSSKPERRRAHDRAITKRCIASSRPGDSKQRQRLEERGHSLPSDATLLGGVLKRSGGTLAAATDTANRRRELFYYLADAIRGYQQEKAKGESTAVGRSISVTTNYTPPADDNHVNRTKIFGLLDDKNPFVHDESTTKSVNVDGPDQNAQNILVTHTGNKSDTLHGPAAENTNLPAIDVGGCGDEHPNTPAVRRALETAQPVPYEAGRKPYGGGSTSDLSSVSVRTLYDFGAPEVRNASTQTVAKHFPEKFASVRKARKLLVSSTFLTSKSSVFSSSTVSARLGGAGGLLSPSVNSQISSLRD